MIFGKFVILLFPFVGFAYIGFCFSVLQISVGKSFSGIAGISECSDLYGFPIGRNFNYLVIREGILAFGWEEYYRIAISFA